MYTEQAKLETTWLSTTISIRTIGNLPALFANK